MKHHPYITYIIVTKLKLFSKKWWQLWLQLQHLCLIRLRRQLCLQLRQLWVFETIVVDCDNCGWLRQLWSYQSSIITSLLCHYDLDWNIPQPNYRMCLNPMKNITIWNMFGYCRFQIIYLDAKERYSIGQPASIHWRLYRNNIMSKFEEEWQSRKYPRIEH